MGRPVSDCDPCRLQREAFVSNLSRDDPDAGDPGHTHLLRARWGTPPETGVPMRWLAAFVCMFLLFSCSATNDSRTPDMVRSLTWSLGGL
jgi:hypothetical protein